MKTLLLLAVILFGPMLSSMVHALPIVAGCFQFTDKKGGPLAGTTEQCSTEANDIVVGFKQHGHPCTIFFTRDNVTVDFKDCLRGQDGIHAAWNSTGFLTGFNFTTGGVPQSNSGLPLSSGPFNDFHTSTGISDLIVTWTLNGRPLGTPFVNKDARDITFRTRVLSR